MDTLAPVPGAVWSACLALALAGPPPSTGPVRLPGAPPERIEVQARPPERVELSVSVLDDRGEPVTGLGEGDFLVREDGQARALVDFGRAARRDDRPISAVLLVDRSGSMGRQLSRWDQAG